MRLKKGMGMFLVAALLASLLGSMLPARGAVMACARSRMKEVTR